jgi:hypothetical protein
MGTRISINASLPENDAAFLNEIEGSRGIIFWGAHAPPRAGDGALAIANFLPITHFGEGAEMCTRGRMRSPDYPPKAFNPVISRPMIKV